MLVTALATPFKRGKIDGFCYEKLVDFQSKHVDALLAAGTTAEAMLLSCCEKKLLVRLAKGAAPQLPLWVGVECAETQGAVKEAARAAELGADCLLVAPPAFVKCTPKGYAKHIAAIAKEVDLPIALYNAPTRCAYTLDANSVKAVADKIRYVKDAGSDVAFMQKLGKYAQVLCGNDEMLTEFVRAGAKGAVSVVSNVAPNLTKRVAEGIASEVEKEKFSKLAKLTTAEVNPIAIKYMLFKEKLFNSYDMRLPLTKASVQTRRKIDEFWEEM